MPTPIWDQMFKPLVAGQRWIAAGLFEPAVREKAGMRWTPGDEVLLRVFGKMVELAFLAVPDEIRLHPRALAAYRRAQGRIPGDAPLVEAPPFMAPPRDRRGLPMHYFPPRQVRRSLMERAGSLVHTTLSLAGLRPRPGPRPKGRLRPLRHGQSPRALVEADRRGRGHVQALRAAGHRDAHAVIGRVGDFGGQTV